ncbi:PREDICTED: corticoliberin [Chaetura pelagica]|uniref:corticoliberin n=1 Tax=Chaetura pelagica TaxID=8897 RepID=UPI0005238E5E|nr:PREDICTED: corticoliberin [Chaetura pelagica]
MAGRQEKLLEAQPHLSAEAVTVGEAASAACESLLGGQGVPSAEIPNEEPLPAGPADPSRIRALRGSQRSREVRGAEPSPAPRTPRGLQSGKRRDSKPNSLDLTFHLLREFLEMSREERLAQKVLSNKLLLQSIGK